MPPSDSAIETPSPSGSGAAEVDPLLGRCLNDTYLVEAVLGEGGMGRVYRARHTRIQQKLFALKVLHPEFARDPQQLARFQREAEAAATITHPNVVGVFDVGRTDDGYSYLACELLSGRDLDQHIDTVGRLDVSSAVSIALQICEALEAAHALSVVHRDLKPQNVFLLADGGGGIPAHPLVKVVDFGLSRFLDQSDAQLTKTGVVMGTPAFMAPEQATGLRGDHRVDIYGIGAILYSALTARPPFEEETVPATLLAVMIEEAPRPRKINPDIPETLELVIQRAMAKKPEDRYPTVHELKSALETFSGAAAGPAHGAARSGTRATTVLHLANDAYELKTSRPRLVLLFFVLVLVCVFMLTAAVSGLELFTGRLTFTRTELVLVLLGVGGTLAMPAGLSLHRFGKKTWSNSAKVLDSVAALRGPLVAGMLAYAGASVTLRFLDEFVGRFGFEALLRREPGAGWPGFTWVLPLVALVAASMSMLKRRWSDGPQNALRRSLLGAPFGVLTLLLCAAILMGGLTWRQLDVEARFAVAPAVRASDAPTSALPATPVAQPAGATTAPLAPLPDAPIARATEEELAAAVAAGEAGLLLLSEKYPRDKRVLEPLVLSFASRSTGYADAMAVAKRLLSVAPELADNSPLSLLVRRAAESPGSASAAAFELMAGPMGSAGPDVLYQMMLADSPVSPRARDALASEAVSLLFSPALRIALDLRAASSCEARIALLPRAAALGDHRSASILGPLAQGAKSGCGKWKRMPCPAACKEQSKEFLAVVRTLLLRGKSAEL